MPRSHLEEIRDRAVKEVAEFFDRLPGTPFSRVPESELPEKEDSLKDPNIIAWKGEIDCEGVWQEVIIALRSTFPDNLPRVYAINLSQIIPHVTRSRENHICSINRSAVFLNTDQPVLIVLQTLQAAAKVICDGLKGRNQADFDAEFSRYWSQETGVRWLSLLRLGGIAREVVVLEFKPPLREYSHLIAETEEGGTRWLGNISRELNGSTKRAIYLPLAKPLRPPFPESNFQVNQTLKKIENSALTCLHKYLEYNRVGEAYVVCSFEVNGNYALAGWIHVRPSPSGRKPLCPGFRNDKIPAEMQLTRCFGRNKIIKAAIERVDGKRLQARVGNEDDKIASLTGKRVIVIGCGSLGSKVVRSLALSGIEKFLLIDNEKLEVENIARHICPMKMIGVNKVDCVAETIKDHVPHVEIETKPIDFYKILSEEPELLDEYDLLICATGDRNLNLRLNEIHLRQSRTTGVLYTWTELRGYASHAILVIPGKGGCLNCTIDDKFQFRHAAILLSQEDSLSQEAGCGSTFLPYGAIEAEFAAATTSRLALSYLSGETKRSARWVYLGDLEDARYRGIPVSKKYEFAGSNRLMKNSLAPQGSCPLCNFRE